MSVTLPAYGGVPGVSRFGSARQRPMRSPSDGPTIAATAQPNPAALAYALAQATIASDTAATALMGASGPYSATFGSVGSGRRRLTGDGLAAAAAAAGAGAGSSGGAAVTSVMPFADAKLKKQLDTHFLQTLQADAHAAAVASAAASAGANALAGAGPQLDPSPTSSRPASSSRTHERRNSAHTTAAPTHSSSKSVASSSGLGGGSRSESEWEKRFGSSLVVQGNGSSSPPVVTGTTNASAPVYYASNNTFRGEDVHHSSNTAFNVQLQKIRERLRDQRRSATAAVAAAANSAGVGREEMMLTGTSPPVTLEPTFAARLAAREREREVGAAGQRGSAPLLHASLYPTSTTSSSGFLPPFATATGTVAPAPLPNRHRGARARGAANSTSARIPPRRTNNLFARSSDSSDEASDGEDAPASNTITSVAPTANKLSARRRRDVSAGGAQPGSGTAPSHALLPRSHSTVDESTLGASSLALDASPTSSTVSSTSHTSGGASISGSPSSSPPLPSSVHLQTILPVRATGDLLRQRAAAAASAREAALNATHAAEVAAEHARRELAESPPAPLYASPQSGTHFAMCSEPPHHIAAVPSYLEPLYTCADRSSLLRRLRAGDDAKLARQQEIGCTVVYDSIDSNPDAETRAPPPLAWQPTAGQLPFYYTPQSVEDSTLVFESRFESGNLRRAIQVDTFEYDLLVRPDINTNTYAQWFYFAVRNTRAGRCTKFNLVNLQKSDSLFNAGMQPLFYSNKKTADSIERGRHNVYQDHPNEANAQSAPGAIGWYRGGYDIAYYRSRGGGGGKTYTLSFSIDFEYDHDTVYIAYAYPFTVSALYRSLDHFDVDPRRRAILRQRTLCRTLAGNDTPLLVITDFTSTASEIAHRPAVVLTARVHPGESNASWMMKGALEWLLALPASDALPPTAALGSPTADLSSHATMAAFLRRQFVFYVIPCLNPDGVISGNTRCSLAGVDLNRQWGAPERDTHPTIFKTKQLIGKIQGRFSTPTAPTLSHTSNTDEKSAENETPRGEYESHHSRTPSAISTHPQHAAPRDVAVFCDLHGHSRAQNVFIYGVECDAATTGGAATAQQPDRIGEVDPSASTSAAPAAAPSRVHRLAERVLPRLLASRSPFFSLDACHYIVRRSKESTARVVVAKELGVAHAFTLEASFGGVSLDPALQPALAGGGVGGPTSQSSAASASATHALHSSRYLGQQFNTRMYEEVGWGLCQSLVDLATPCVYARARSDLEAAFPVAPSAGSKEDAAGMEDSDDDGGAGDGEGEVLRTKVARRSHARRRGSRSRTRAAKKRKKKEKEKEAGSAGGPKRTGRARSKSTDVRVARASSAGASVGEAPQTSATRHVRALLEKLGKEGSVGGASHRPLSSSGSDDFDAISPSADDAEEDLLLDPSGDDEPNSATNTTGASAKTKGVSGTQSRLSSATLPRRVQVPTAAVTTLSVTCTDADTWSRTRDRIAAAGNAVFGALLDRDRAASRSRPASRAASPKAAKKKTKKKKVKKQDG